MDAGPCYEFRDTGISNKGGIYNTDKLLFRVLIFFLLQVFFDGFEVTFRLGRNRPLICGLFFIGLI